MIKITSLIKTIIFKLFLFIAILISLVTFLLISGIRLDSLELPSAHIKNLFIQYDEGLILTADTVEITPPTEPSEPMSGDEIVSITNKLLLASKFVNRLEVKSLTYDTYTVHAAFEAGRLKISHPDGNVEASISTVDDRIVVDARTIRYTPYNISAQAKLFADPFANRIRAFVTIDSDLLKSSLELNADEETVTFHTAKSTYAYEQFSGSFWTDGSFDIEEKKLELTGKLDTLDILTDFRVESDMKLLGIHLFNTNILSLASLMQTLNLAPAVSEWVYGKILAKSYVLESFYLPIDLETKTPLLEKMAAKAVLEQGSVLFHKDLERVKAAEIDLDIRGTDLFFRSKEAYYAHTYVDINGSITSLTDKPLLTVNIASDTPMDATLHEILKAYDIPMEYLQQKEGSNASTFTLTLGLGDDRFATLVDSRFKEALFSLYGEAIRSKAGHVTVDNATVNLDNINLAYGTLADLNITGELDLTAKNLRSNIMINRLFVADGRLVDMRGVPTDVNLTYDPKVRLEADKLHTILGYDDGELTVDVSDLTPFVKNSPLLRTFDIHKGNLHFRKKGETMEASAVVESNGTSLMENGEFIKKFKATYVKDPTQNRANLNDKVFVDISPKKIDVTYSGIDISIDRLMERYSATSQRREIISERYEETTQTQEEPVMINVYARDSNFLYEDRVLPARQYNLLVNGEYINFSLDHGKTHIDLNKEFENLTITAKNIDSNFTRKLFKFEMSEGKAGLLASGNIKTNEFYGVLSVKNATIKGFTLINNIIAFVNTVPSLVTLQNPGFNAEGYKLKKGTIEFYISGDTLYLTTLRLIGVNTDIFGYGQVDLKTKEVTMTLTLSTVKGLSNLLGKIPLVGYVLLGDDKTIGTLISVTGPLENPKVETTFAENAALYPFSIIKRTVLWPFKLFEDDTEKEE